MVDSDRKNFLLMMIDSEIFTWTLDTRRWNWIHFCAYYDIVISILLLISSGNVVVSENNSNFYTGLEDVKAKEREISYQLPGMEVVTSYGM